MDIVDINVRCSGKTVLSPAEKNRLKQLCNNSGQTTNSVFVAEFESPDGEQERIFNEILSLFPGLVVRVDSINMGQMTHSILFGRNQKQVHRWDFLVWALEERCNLSKPARGLHGHPCHWFSYVQNQKYKTAGE